MSFQVASWLTADVRVILTLALIEFTGIFTQLNRATERFNRKCKHEYVRSYTPTNVRMYVLILVK